MYIPNILIYIFINLPKNIQYTRNILNKILNSIRLMIRYLYYKPIHTILWFNSYYKKIILLKTVYNSLFYKQQSKFPDFLYLLQKPIYIDIRYVRN